jgi:hypothetical protein
VDFFNRVDFFNGIDALLGENREPALGENRDPWGLQSKCGTQVRLPAAGRNQL